jgi:hypothetical protein
MPRPAGVDLHEIFGPTEPAPNWEQRADYHMYFVHGVQTAMAHVGVRPTRKEFLPLRERVARERQNWETALQAETWANFMNLSQVNRFVEIRNLTFPTAASGVLAIELFLRDHGYSGDIYQNKDCYIVAQDSYITRLDHHSFATICSAASRAEGKHWHACLCTPVGQKPELFDELVSGRLVTAGLAKQILSLLKRFEPAFAGEVSNDFNARRDSLRQLRHAAYEGGGKGAQNAYHRRITGAQAEYYPA